MTFHIVLKIKKLAVLLYKLNRIYIDLYIGYIDIVERELYNERKRKMGYLGIDGTTLFPTGPVHFKFKCSTCKCI